MKEGITNRTFRKKEEEFDLSFDSFAALESCENQFIQDKLKLESQNIEAIKKCIRIENINKVTFRRYVYNLGASSNLIRIILPFSASITSQNDCIFVINAVSECGLPYLEICF